MKKITLLVLLLFTTTFSFTQTTGCNDCSIEAYQNRADDILDTLLSLGNCTYELCFTRLPFVFGCGDEVTVTWNGQIQNLNSDRLCIQTTFTNGQPQQNITITVDRGQCFVIQSFDYTIQTPDCVESSCEDVCPIINTDIIIDNITNNGCTYDFSALINDPQCFDPTEYRYQWSISDGNSNSITSSLINFNNLFQYTFSNSGSYIISLFVWQKDTLYNGNCSGSTIKFINVSCNTRQTNSKINIKSNPIKQNQELQFSGIDLNDIDKIEILDITANVVMAYKSKSKSLNIDNLKSGVYFIKFHTTKGIELKKIIIE